MNEDLKYIFANVNEWHKFAEAKNAALLALNLAAIVGVLQISHFDNAKVLQGLFVIAFAISLVFTITGLSPGVNHSFRLYKKMNDNDFNRKKAKLNFLFFGHIAELSSDQFLELYTLKTSNSNITEADKDFASQITNNAELALQKFSLFAWAARLSTITFLIGALIACIKFIL